MFGLALLLVAVLWELYKWVGPEEAGLRVDGPSPDQRPGDAARLGDALALRAARRRGSSEPILLVVLSGAWFSLRLALAGFAIGTGVGLPGRPDAAVPPAERGLLPYLVLSQTVPLIALAPLVVAGGAGSPRIVRPGQPGCPPP